MTGPSCVVLKFGGSVLQQPEAFGQVVHEIQRWRRQVDRVVVVVSAQAGCTDSLLADAESASPSVEPYALAALVAVGEERSAAQLAVALDRAGVLACVLSPATLELRATGEPLDALPTSVRDDLIVQRCDAGDVVVVPGFWGVDEVGRVVLFGRGGSDLTALFLAYALTPARCRLIKDVDGLYDRDPAEHPASARRYESATFAAALATNGSIVQHKAVRFAKRLGIAFELGSIQGLNVTKIGGSESQLAVPVDALAGVGALSLATRPLRVGLLGCGTVGLGVLELLRELPGDFEVEGVAVRRESSREQLGRSVPEVWFTTKVDELFAKDLDVLIDATNAVRALGPALDRALELGVHVVSANKALLVQCEELGQATHGDIARRSNHRDASHKPERGQLHCSAAVGGNMPLLERLDAAQRVDESPVHRIDAVLNGTVNFVLHAMQSGTPLQVALKNARSLGLAEANVEADLRGEDAAMKLCLIARRLGCPSFQLNDVAGERPTDAQIEQQYAALPAGHVLRQIARLRIADGLVHASVAYEAVPKNHPLAGLTHEHNGACIERQDGSSVWLRGKGAGRWPTAEAIFGDVQWLRRQSRQRTELGVVPVKQDPQWSCSSLQVAKSVSKTRRAEPTLSQDAATS